MHTHLRAYLQKIGYCTFATCSGQQAFWRDREESDCITGDLQVWDLERLAEPVYSAKANTEMIYAIDGCGDQACAPARSTCMMLVK